MFEVMLFLTSKPFIVGFCVFVFIGVGGAAGLFSNQFEDQANV